MDPFTIAIGAQVIGQGLNMYQQKQTAEYNQDVAEFNKVQSKVASEDEAERLTQEEARVIGRSRAIAGASGIAADVGSNADVIDDIRTSFADDIAAVRYAGDIGAFRAELGAELAQLESQQAITAGLVQIGTTALTLYNPRPGGGGGGGTGIGAPVGGISGANVSVAQGGIV